MLRIWNHDDRESCLDLRLRPAYGALRQWTSRASLLAELQGRRLTLAAPHSYRKEQVRFHVRSEKDSRGGRFYWFNFN